MIKKIKYILILFLILSIFTNGQSPSWKLVDKYWISSDSGIHHYQLKYEGIDCYDSLNCIAVGNFGLEYPWNRVTTDGGKTWYTTLADSGKYIIDSITGKKYWYQPPRVKSVLYKDMKLCIIGCDSGYYYRSTDRCQTWEKNKLPTNTTIESIFMYNQKLGGIASDGTIFLTFNGGISYQKSYIQLPDSLMPKAFEGISILEPGRIIVLGTRLNNSKYHEYLIESNDSGKTWSFLNNIFEKRFYSILFINSKIGWVIGGDQIKSNTRKQTILHTEDGGKNWIIQLDTLVSPYTPLNNISFADSLNGVALGYYWNLWRTSDGGNHWYKDNSDTVIYPDLQCIAYPVKSTIFAGNYDSMIFKYCDDTLGVDENWNGFEPTLKEGDSYVYPNPSNGIFKIKLNSGESGKAKILITDFLGKTIYSKEAELILPEPVFQFNLPNAASGAYFYNMQSEGKIITRGSFFIVR